MRRLYGMLRARTSIDVLALWAEFEVAAEGLFGLVASDDIYRKAHFFARSITLDSGSDNLGFSFAQ